VIDQTDGCPDCGATSHVHDDGCEYLASQTCPWCLNPSDDEWSEKLCRTHEAEYEGLSVSELDRRDAERDAEYSDVIGDDGMRCDYVQF